MTNNGKIVHAVLVLRPKRNVYDKMRTRESVRGTPLCYLYLKRTSLITKDVIGRVKNASDRLQSIGNKESQRQRMVVYKHYLNLSHTGRGLIFFRFLHRRVAQLESKLDSIVTLLASNQSNQNAYLSPESSHSDACEPSQCQSSVGNVLALAKNSSTETSVPGASGSADFVLGVKLQDAERLLRLFREDLAVHFPFVNVPDGSVENLHRLRPVLVMAIIVAASFRSLSQQRQLAEKLSEYLSLHVLLRGEKSLDLLQGLLVLASWYVFVFFRATTWSSIDT